MLLVTPLHDVLCHTSEIVSDRIAKLEGEESFSSVIFVVPEASKASIERIVNETSIIRAKNSDDGIKGNLKIGACLPNVDVLSFMRLAVRINELCGNISKESSDETLLRSAIYSILVKHSEEFKTFGKLVGRFEYIDLLISLLGDFSRYGIDSDMLMQALENTDITKDVVYFEKVHDLQLLFDYLEKLNYEYNLTLTSGPMDKACEYLKLARTSSEYGRLKSFLKNASFVVLGFGATRYLTPKEIEFIGLLNEFAAQIELFPLSSNRSEDEDKTIYTFGNEIISKLKKDVRGVVIQNDSSDTSKSSNHVESICLEAIEKYSRSLDVLSTISLENETSRVSGIISINIDSLEDRLSYIGNEIVKLTRKAGYRYKDIRILCGNQEIMARLQSVLDMYGLDMFVDRKMILNNTPILRYASILLKLPTEKFSLDIMLKAMKTGVLPILPSEVDKFENYCIKNNMQWETRIFDEDKYRNDDKSEENSTGAMLWQRVVLRVLVPLRLVAMQITNAKTIMEKAELLSKHLSSRKKNIELLRDELLSRGESEDASALVRGYDSLMRLLVSFTDEFSNIEISQEQFEALIRINMRNKTSGSIPLMVDSIEIVSLPQSYITNCKVLFVVGADSSNFPFESVSDGIMSSKELNQLANAMQIDLPDKVTTKRKGSFVESCLAIGAVTEKVYFVHEKEKPKDILHECLLPYAGQIEQDCFTAPNFSMQVERRYNYETTRFEDNTMTELLKSGVRMSVSGIESYYTCPMQYMTKNVLKIYPRDDATIVQSNHIGTIVHGMFEHSIKSLMLQYDTLDKLSSFVDNLDDQKTSELANEYFVVACEKSDITDACTPEFERKPGIKIKRIFQKCFKSALSSCIDSGYLPSFYEYKIGKDSQVIIESQKHEKFEFTGYIDRVDENQSKQYRILDYKTGNKKIELKKTFAGKQIQLFAYAKFLSDIERKQVVDAGYLSTALKLDKKGKPIHIEPEYSLLTQDEFNIVTDYVQIMIQKAINEISEGNANALVNSLASRECSFCVYQAACSNGGRTPKCKKGRTFGSGKKGDEEVLQAMKVEVQAKKGVEDSND